MSNFIHGDNLEHKIKIEKDQNNKELLNEIRFEYLKWKDENLNIKGATRSDVQMKVELFNKYKNFIGQLKFKKESGNSLGFTSQSQLQSILNWNRRKHITLNSKKKDTQQEHIL